MHHRLGTLSLAVPTVLLAVAAPLLPLGSLGILAAPAPTTQERSDRWFQAGVEQVNQGQLREALATYQQGRALSRERGDQLGEAEALSGMGEVYLYGLYPKTEALKVLQRPCQFINSLRIRPKPSYATSRRKRERSP